MKTDSRWVKNLIKKKICDIVIVLEKCQYIYKIIFIIYQIMVFLDD